MPSHIQPRRYFKITELNLMKQLASEGKSQSYTAHILNRDPGVIAQAAIRYGIKYHAPPGRPKVDPNIRRERQRIYQRLRRAKFKPPKIKVIITEPIPTIEDKGQVTRFDDPRVMIKKSRN